MSLIASSTTPNPLSQTLCQNPVCMSYPVAPSSGTLKPPFCSSAGLSSAGYSGDGRAGGFGGALERR